MPDSATTMASDEAGHREKADVVVYRAATSKRADHDHATCATLARMLAQIKGCRYAGEYAPAASYSNPLFFVPTDTVIGVEHARALGIASEADLFGGVVPHPFVATKCISHPVVDARASVPDGWSQVFGQRVQAAVLKGYSAFSIDDALRAGLRLFDEGLVRIKQALGIGGSGQTVVADRRALERALADANADEVSRYGIALEQHLVNVTTHSVGQVRIDDLLATYCGTQRLTSNNHGQMVYGGSDLFVARGGFDALLALNPAPSARRAIEQARIYDAAALECFAGLFASRRNYDIAEGIDAFGRVRSGVLEQSWRIGGASGAEVAALVAFRDDPSLAWVRASCVEVYGPDVALPAQATVYFQGVDKHAGPLTKYFLLSRDVHP
jgi:hypothetical protein